MQSTADFSPDRIYSRLSLTSLLIQWLFQEYLLLYQFLWRERRAVPHPSAVCSGPALIELNLSSGHKVTLTHNCQTNALICQNSVSGKIIHNSSIPLSACITGTCCGFLDGSVFHIEIHIAAAVWILLNPKEPWFWAAFCCFWFTYFPDDLRVLAMHLWESKTWHRVCFFRDLN